MAGKRYTVDDWQQRLNSLNQPVLIVGKHKQGKKEIFKIQCYKCGGIFAADRRALHTACNLRELGKKKVNWCPYCNNKRCLTGVNDVATLRKDLLKYFVNPEIAREHGVGCHIRVKLRCPECKQIKTLQLSDLCSKGFHCDYCNDNVSLGEKMLRNLIVQLPIEEYDFERSEPWSQNKRYDVYFVYKSIKYLIEVDGEQHVKDTSWSAKEWQRENDNLKTTLALQNGYELIRIKAYKTDFDYIKRSILESRLSDLFDLSDIDWNLICKQTVTSRNIEIAEYYMEHKGITMMEMASHFHVSTPTIQSALKKLSKIGLCEYSKEKVIKNALNYRKEQMVKDNTPFTVYAPDGTNLGKFKSGNECYRIMKDTFDSIDLKRRQLSDIIFKGDEYKGYKFIYDNGLYQFHKEHHPQLFVACELFDSGVSIREISEKMNSNTSTIYKYLIAGKNMGICTYKRHAENANK